GHRQLNGCAFCLQFHLNVARKAGLASAKIDLVATWRDVGHLTPGVKRPLWHGRRRWALDGEQQPIPDALYDEVSTLFTPQE
ncbi:carboxymuconolactone decarboxylase family protein, partial [Pantoea ananatis]